MPDSPRAQKAIVVSFVLEGQPNPITLFKERMEDADAIVRRAVQVRAWWITTQGAFPYEYPMPTWPAGAHGDLDVPGWMLPYVAEIVSSTGTSLQVRGFLDLRLVSMCAIMLTELAPDTISVAPFSE